MSGVLADWQIEREVKIEPFAESASRRACRKTGAETRAGICRGEKCRNSRRNSGWSFSRKKYIPYPLWTTVIHSGTRWTEGPRKAECLGRRYARQGKSKGPQGGLTIDRCAVMPPALRACLASGRSIPSLSSRSTQVGLIGPRTAAFQIDEAKPWRLGMLRLQAQEGRCKGV